MKKETKLRINILILFLLLFYVVTLYIMLANTVDKLENAYKILDEVEKSVQDLDTYIVEMNVVESQIEDLQKELDEIIVKTEGIE